MSDKIKAKIAAWIAGTTGFTTWILTLAPAAQASVMGTIATALPVEWRPYIVDFTGPIAAISTIYALYKASHSGPQTPPANSPQE